MIRNRLYDTQTGHETPPASLIQPGEQALASHFEYRMSQSAEWALAGDVQGYIASGMMRRALTAQRETLLKARLN